MAFRPPSSHGQGRGGEGKGHGLAEKLGGEGRSHGRAEKPPTSMKDGSWISADARQQQHAAPWNTQAGRARRLKPRVWRAAFDAEGRLVRMPQVLRAVLDGGVDRSIRGEVWEFLLGSFSLDSTAEERNYVREARRERFAQLVQQCRRMHGRVGTGQLAFPVGSKIMDVRILHHTAHSTAAAAAAAASPATAAGDSTGAAAAGSAAAAGGCDAGVGDAAAGSAAAVVGGLGSGGDTEQKSFRHSSTTTTVVTVAPGNSCSSTTITTTSTTTTVTSTTTNTSSSNSTRPTSSPSGSSSRPGTSNSGGRTPTPHATSSITGSSSSGLPRPLSGSSAAGDRFPRQFSDKSAGSSTPAIRMEQLIEEGGPRLHSSSFSCSIDLFDLDDPRAVFGGDEEDDDEEDEDEEEGFGEKDRGWARERQRRYERVDHLRASDAAGVRGRGSGSGGGFGSGSGSGRRAQDGGTSSSSGGENRARDAAGGSREGRSSAAMGGGEERGGGVVAGDDSGEGSTVDRGGGERLGEGEGGAGGAGGAGGGGGVAAGAQSESGARGAGLSGTLRTRSTDVGLLLLERGAEGAGGKQRVRVARSHSARSEEPLVAAPPAAPATAVPDQGTSAAAPVAEGPQSGSGTSAAAAAAEEGPWGGAAGAGGAGADGAAYPAAAAGEEAEGSAFDDGAGLEGQRRKGKKKWTRLLPGKGKEGKEWKEGKDGREIKSKLLSGVGSASSNSLLEADVLVIEREGEAEEEEGWVDAGGGGEGGVGGVAGGDSKGPWQRGVKSVKKAHKKLRGYLGAADSAGGEAGAGESSDGGEGARGLMAGGNRLKKVLSADWGGVSVDDLLASIRAPNHTTGSGMSSNSAGHPVVAAAGVPTGSKLGSSRDGSSAGVSQSGAGWGERRRGKGDGAGELGSVTERSVEERDDEEEGGEEEEEGRGQEGQCEGAAELGSGASFLSLSRRSQLSPRAGSEGIGGPRALSASWEEGVEGVGEGGAEGGRGQQASLIVGAEGRQAAWLGDVVASTSMRRAMGPGTDLTPAAAGGGGGGEGAGGQEVLVRRRTAEARYRASGSNVAADGQGSGARPVPASAGAEAGEGEKRGQAEGETRQEGGGEGRRGRLAEGEEEEVEEGEEEEEEEPCAVGRALTGGDAGSMGRGEGGRGAAGPFVGSGRTERSEGSEGGAGEGAGERKAGSILQAYVRQRSFNGRNPTAEQREREEGEGAGEEEGGDARLTVDPLVAAELGVPPERVAEWLWTLHKISVDVERTDRHMAFYEDRSNMAAMSDILAVHAWIDPATGFCQGMCDLLSPFIILFPHPADAFWCFESLFSRIRHNFLMEGPLGILRQLAVLRDVVALVDPELAAHLEELGADNFMFAFRMLLVLFRRELPLLDVIVMWEMMWAADYDPRMAAVLLHHPPEGLSLAAEPLTWSSGLPPLQPPSSATPDPSPAHPDHPSLPPTYPDPSPPLPFPAMPPIPPSLPPVLALGLGKRSGRKGGSMGGSTGGGTGGSAGGSMGGMEGVGGSGMSRWGEARVGDEDLAVFCVAAILRVNRKRLLQVEGSDEAIKMFNDVELVLDVASCVHLAIKIRAKYCKKTPRAARQLR
ncbi:hypothetical protein CLOP_g9862 [Closterium sp. NIES-67]|nr:hypothetical protein CLOP_g9862 [Closterium sp. NIES-67]